MNETYAAIPYEKICSFLSMGESFAVSDTERGAVLACEREAYRVEITLGNIYMESSEICATGVKYTDGGVVFSYSSPAGDELETVVTDITGRVLLYDMRPVDNAENGFEAVHTALSSAQTVAALFGDELLTAAEREALSVCGVLDVLDMPDMVRFIDTEILESACAFLKLSSDSLAEPLHDCIFARENGGEASACSRFAKAAKDSTLKEKLVQKYLPVCDGANRDRAKNPFVDWAKYEALFQIADRAARERGFDGEFPSYTKGTGYIRFSLVFKCYEVNEAEYHYELGAAFGIDGKDPMKFYTVGYCSDRLTLDIMEKRDTGEAVSEAFDTLFCTVASLCEGGEVPESFYYIAEKAQYDRSWDVRLSALGAFCGAFGVAMALLLIIFGDMSASEYFSSALLGAAFAALIGISGYFGVCLKKHPKLLFKPYKGGR